MRDLQNALIKKNLRISPQIFSSIVLFIKFNVLLILLQKLINRNHSLRKHQKFVVVLVNHIAC